MTNTNKFEINKVLLKAHEHAVQSAIETAIRTGTCLIEYKNGRVIRRKPKFKYVLVPIKSSKKKSLPNKTKKNPSI